MLIAYERPWKATIHSPFHFFAGRVGLQGGHARALLWQKQTASPRHGSGAKFGQWASDSQIWQITKTSTTSCNTKLVWNVKALAMEMISTTILCVARRCFLVRSLCPWLWVGALRCVCAVVLLHNWNVFWNISAKSFSAEFGPRIWAHSLDSQSLCGVFFFLKTVQIWQEKSRHQIRKFHSNFRWTVANGAKFHAFYSMCSFPSWRERRMHHPLETGLIGMPEVPQAPSHRVTCNGTTPIPEINLDIIFWGRKKHQGNREWRQTLDIANCWPSGKFCLRRSSSVGPMTWVVVETWRWVQQKKR